MINRVDIRRDDGYYYYQYRSYNGNGGKKKEISYLLGDESVDGKEFSLPREEDREDT